ncbi:MAG TPA: ABC transporter permease, partial [Chryseolinea sp.]|nr:ABC transporter permease [Chryseolinea sp.]
MRFFLRKEYLEEIEGDMEEIFYDNVEQHSLRKAKRMYAWEMLKLLRPVLVKNLGLHHYISQQAMFKNYFKTSFRNLMRNPLNSFINVFGLAMAIGICMLVYAFARWTYSTDQFHEHKNEVHLVTFFANRDGSVHEYGRTPRPLAEMLRQDFPQIEKSCRVEDRSVVMKYEDHVFHERVRYVDPEFLDMFTFPLKWGISSSLSDLNSVILSEDMSIKYFGEENPIGQSILMKYDETRSKVFKITGVAKKIPNAHTIDFNFLINFENLRTEPNYAFDDWSQSVRATLIQVKNPAEDIPSIQQRMAKYKTLQNKAADEDWAITSFGFQPLATLHEQPKEFRDNISASSDSNSKSIIFLSCVGILMLVLACLNYINIAIVSAAKRLKEIGVRKTIGATRKIIIVQFLTENLVVTFFALAVGLLLGAFFFIPWFERMFSGLDFEFTLYDKNLWIYLPSILLVTALASGIYPSLYVSKFQVVRILKGSVEFGKRNPLTKIFLTFQLILTCLFITSAVMFTWNADYLAKRSWGYDNHAALYASIPDRAAFEKLEAVMKQNPSVVSISGSQHHIGKDHHSVIMQWPDRQFEADEILVDASYFKTMGLQMKEGRIFEEDYESEKQTVVVNEVLVKSLALQNPIGQVFKVDSVSFEIIGVVKDFHNYSFFNTIKPIMLRIAEKDNYHYLSLKVNAGSQPETYKALQKAWIELYPETPFDGGYQDDTWGSYYISVSNHGTVWRVFAIVAILL